MVDPTALYPRPPDAANNALAGDPARVINLMQGVTQLQRSQAELGAKNAIGKAWQGALNPDGSVDMTRLTGGLKDPAAAYGAPEATSTMLAQRGQQIQNGTAQFEQFAKQNQFVIDGIGVLADKPNPTHEDVRNLAVTLARNTGVPSSILNSWIAGMPRDPAKLKEYLVTLRNLAIGSPGASTPDLGGYTQSGAPLSVTRGQAGYGRAGVGPGAPAAPQGAPGIPGLRPGQAEASATRAVSGAQAGAALTAANDSSMVRKGMLGNLEEDLNHFNPGAGSEWELLAKNWANRNLPIPQQWGGLFDAKSIASQEAFNKQAVQLAQQQFAAIGGTGTDAKFSSAFETSPNQALTKLGNQGIIKLLKGNEDAIQAKNRAWLKWKKDGHGDDTWDQFSAEFSERFDPRVFQFKYMTPKERLDYISRMNNKDEIDLLRGDIYYAHQQGWVDYGLPKDTSGKK